MSDYFSEDLLINILHRLSMKTLLRCGSVCKSWKTLIASSYFINAHLNFNRYNAPQYLIRTCKESLRKTNDFITNDFIIDDGQDSSYESEDDSPKYRLEETYLSYCINSQTFDLHNKFDVPFISSNSLFRIGGSCNGLICLTDYGYTGCGFPSIIWNPFINKAVFIPQSIYFDDNCRYRLAFGFDMATNDYKIVRINSYNAEIFRLSTRVWEDITHLAPRNCHIYGQSVNLNGAAHWIGINYLKIVVFDMHSEVFRVIKFSSSLKKNLVKASRSDFELAGGNDLLCLIHGNVCNDPSKFDVWLMKEYGVVKSWIKQYSFNFDPSFEPYDFLPNGDLLWENENSLISYNFESKQSRVIVSCTTEHHGLHVCNYVPSLVLNDQKVDFSDSNKSILGLNVESIYENLQI